MWKKLSKILLAAMIFFSGVILIPFEKAHAIGVDTVVKAAGGKMVVRGLAEKAGMALSPKQLDNVVDVIEKRTFDGDQKSIDFLTKANNVIDMPLNDPASKSGFKKYLVDPLLWISGLDLIFDVVDGFKDGYDNSTPVSLFAQCPEDFSNSLYLKADFDKWGNYIKYDTHSSDGTKTGTNILVYENDDAIITSNPNSGMYVVFIENPMQLAIYKQNTDGSYSRIATNSSTTSFQVGGNIDNLIKSSDEVVCEKPVMESDVVDISTVDNSTKQHFDNDTYTTNTVYNLEIELPDSPDYNDSEPWNQPDINIVNEVNVEDDSPVVVDPDPDGDDGKGDSIDVLVRVDDEIPIHEKFFLEMADMGQKVEDMYNGVVHFFDVTIDGFTTLTDGMTGFVAFLDDFFDWLPAEYVALLGSGFTLGVVSFFLRR